MSASIDGAEGAESSNFASNRPDAETGAEYRQLSFSLSVRCNAHMRSEGFDRTDRARQNVCNRLHRDRTGHELVWTYARPPEYTDSHVDSQPDSTGTRSNSL